MFDPNIIEAIKRHAREAFPNECCGLVLDKYLPCPNLHEDPANFFRLDEKRILREAKKGKLRAVVHSHTNGKDYPSCDDMEAQMRMAVAWGIVTVDKHAAYEPFWFGDQAPIPPLRERRFRHGVTDCYALVRDWYRVHRQIVLLNLPREWDWWEKGEDILGKHFAESGFVQIERRDLKWGDCVMGKVYGYGTPRVDRPVNHCGVYLGDNQVLHHLPDRPSRIDMLGPWTKYITHYCRYKG